PHYLADAYAADLRECSAGFARFRIVQWIDVDGFPVKKDGFKYAEEEYLRTLRANGPWHQPDEVDYKALIRDYHLDKRVANGVIDEVWVFSMPYSGYYESTMAGRGSYFCNS